MDVVLDLMTHSRAAVKSQKHEPEHVERSHQRRDEADEPEQTIRPAFGRPCLPENFVFGEKSCERRNAGNREGRNEHRPMRNGNALVQIAHVTHVLLTAHGVNDRS